MAKRRKVSIDLSGYSLDPAIEREGSKPAHVLKRVREFLVSEKYYDEVTRNDQRAAADWTAIANKGVGAELID